MCIIFIYKRCKNSATNSCLSKYKLIIAANRDEYLDRPATPAHFWSDSPHVLAGQDQTSGKEGGTWLGVCKDGRFGMLTNYRGQQPHEEKQGRGALLTRFFSQLSCETFMKEVEDKEDQYSAFNMVVGSLKGGKEPLLHSFSYTGDRKFQSLSEGIHCISNGTIDCQWNKVKHGKQIFSGVIASSKTDDDHLTKSLLQKLLLNKERSSDDDPMLEEFEDKKFGSATSSIFVEFFMYGTRTNTIFLVDDDDNALFYERTMKTPINPGNPQWIVNRFRFKLESTK